MAKHRVPEILFDLPSGTYFTGSVPSERVQRSSFWLRWNGTRAGRRILGHVLRRLSDELLDDDLWHDPESP